MVSLGKEKAESTWEGLFTIVSVLAWPLTAFRYGRIHQYVYFMKNVVTSNQKNLLVIY